MAMMPLVMVVVPVVALIPELVGYSFPCPLPLHKPDTPPLPTQYAKRVEWDHTALSAKRKATSAGRVADVCMVEQERRVAVCVGVTREESDLSVYGFGGGGVA